MKIDGRCHCGHVSYEADVDPQSITICHCTDCQMLSGSAFRANIRASGDTFALRGKPITYVKTAESGNKRRHAFCGECGSPIYSSDIENVQSYSLRVGTITQRGALLPKQQIWRRSAVGWVDTLARVPSRDKE